MFHAFGGNTDYLDEVGDMLAAIHQGLNDSQAFIDVLLEHEFPLPQCCYLHNPAAQNRG